MTSYNLIFQAQSGGAVAFSWQIDQQQPVPGGPVTLGEGDEVAIELLPYSGGPAIDSISLTFTSQVTQEPVTPFLGHSVSPFIWSNGTTGDLTVVKNVANGDDWCFSATMTASDGSTYDLPDPEVVVDDSPGNKKGPGNANRGALQDMASNETL